jgi:hypothetical protein
MGRGCTGKPIIATSPALGETPSSGFSLYTFLIYLNAKEMKMA